jgi:calcineurin-like phosphoesterase family protein
LKPYFETVVPHGGGIERTFDGIDCWITHYPTKGRRDRFNLVGHIHGAWKVQLNMLNVGVDVHSYRPLDSERIPFYHKAISEYYDDDVWAAYGDANTRHFYRGKEGSYFKE